MRWSLPCLCLVGTLGAQVPLHVVAVERKGPPPYLEAADRIYRLDGGQDRGFHVGDRLLVRRTGEPRAFGHLRVTEIRDHQSESRFEPRTEVASAYPMKGDLALREDLKWLPETPRLEADPIPRTTAPQATPEAPPQEGLLFFLPQRGDLSPVGLKKLESWVETWGAGGRWAVQVPTAKALKPALQKQRAEAIQSALHALGIERVTLETDPRTTEGRYDPAWIRHWE